MKFVPGFQVGLETRKLTADIPFHQPPLFFEFLIKPSCASFLLATLLSLDPCDIVEVPARSIQQLQYHIFNRINLFNLLKLYL